MGGNSERKKKPSAKQRRLQATAYHEAGHAVVALSLGLKVRYVTIRPDKEQGYLVQMVFKWNPRVLVAPVAPATKFIEFWVADSSLLYKPLTSPQVHLRLRQRDSFEKDMVMTLAAGLAERVFSGTYHERGSSRERQEVEDKAERVIGSGKSLTTYCAWLWLRAEEYIESTLHSEEIRAIAETLLCHPKGTLDKWEIQVAIRSAYLVSVLKQGPPRSVKTDASVSRAVRRRS